MEYTDSTQEGNRLAGNLHELLVSLNDGFTAFYDKNKSLCKTSPPVSHYAFHALLPNSLKVFDNIELTDLPRVLDVQNFLGYHCVLSASGSEQYPWALSVIADSKSISKIAHDLPIGVINVDSNWNAVFINSRCADMLKTSLDELYGRKWIDYLPPSLAREFRDHVSDLENCRNLYKTRIEFVTPLGGIYIFSVQLAAYFDSRDNFISASVTLNDVTNEFRAESKLQYMADHDSLTELFNRSAFIRKVEEMDANRFSRSLFLFIDIDRFKEINDTMGHKFGDLVLKFVGRKISSAVRENDLSARFGGDEFVVCMSSITSDRTVEGIARKIDTLLNSTCVLDGREIELRCSIGIAWTPTIQFEENQTRAEKVQAVLDAADQGMYEVKRGALTAEHFKIYDVNLREQKKWLNNQKKELQDVLSDDGLTCHFQPIYSVDGQIRSVEALARFKTPFQYFKGIESVISFAKRQNMELALFDNALKEALKGFALLREHQPALTLNMNVDVSQLEEENFSKVVTQLCMEFGVPLSSVCIEITEMMLERNSTRVQRQIKQLQRRGFLISMDDFGTGFSSFKRLMNYDFNELKIDRYFVQNVSTNDKYKKTLTAMIAMGKSLDLQILAEGVETEEQFHLCRNLGAQLFQGFYFSKPRDSDTLIKMLNSQPCVT